MTLGKAVGLGPGHMVLDEDPAPLPKRGTAPNFRPMSLVAKRSPISATAELVILLCQAALQYYADKDEVAWSIGLSRSLAL